MSYLSHKQFLDDSEITLKSEFKKLVATRQESLLSAKHNITSNNTVEWIVDVDEQTYTFIRKFE